MAAICWSVLVAYPLLPVAPLPQVDFPTILVTRSCPAPAPRPWRPRSRQPLERQFGADPRRHPDDLDQRARQQRDHGAVRSRRATSTARRRISRPRSTRPAGSCRRTCRRRRPTARSIRPTRRSWSSRVTSDTLPLTQVDDYAENMLGPADQPDLRRRPGVDRRPAEAGRPHPGRPGEDRRLRALARGRARA